MSGYVGGEATKRTQELRPIQQQPGARETRGFVLETSASLGSDHTLARQIALHGNYVVEGSAGLGLLPEAGSLMIVAPAKNRNARESAVRVLAMVG